MQEKTIIFLSIVAQELGTRLAVPDRLTPPMMMFLAIETALHSFGTSYGEVLLSEGGGGNCERFAAGSFP